ncbi:MAG: tail fiber domain-containing protein, partial [Bacteroidia bacterium]|nr:tail fiber domain-containing protein [Bacteroidia bacterium]
GLNSTAIGAINQVSGDYSFAAGLSNIISGDNSIALGQQAEALGVNSNAIGLGSEAIGDYSTAIGHETMASGLNSIAVGAGANATAIGSVAFGTSNDASGQFSTALGYLSDAIGNYSTAFGRNITSTSYGSFIIGVYNSNDFGNTTQWIDSDVLFQIGNGLSDATRSNALTVRKDGSQILTSNSFGLQISTGNNTGDHGIEINNAGGNGIEINSSGDNGLVVSGAINDGLVATADDVGARVTGDNVGLYASGGPLQNDIPDIILGSSTLSAFSDDGIISTNPERLGSDMFLRSYDAVVVHLDYDDNESGSFIVRNGLGDNVFTVNESGVVRVNGSIVHSSDKRLKEDISDLSYGLREILNLQPKSYHWKDQEQNKKSLGLIAQDVQPIINEIVTVKDDEAQTLGISYTELIPVLINAIKEQQDIIDQQNQSMGNMRVQLKSQGDAISNLKAQMNQLINTLNTNQK